MKCGVCGQEWAIERGQLLRLTEAERTYVKEQTGDDVESYFYCSPCWKLLSNQPAGASLIRGTLELNLRSIGHPRAQEMAQDFYQRLTRLRRRD